MIDTGSKFFLNHIRFDRPMPMVLRFAWVLLLGIVLGLAISDMAWGSLGGCETDIGPGSPSDQRLWSELDTGIVLVPPYFVPTVVVR